MLCLHACIVSKKPCAVLRCDDEITMAVRKHWAFTLRPCCVASPLALHLATYKQPHPLYHA